MDNANAISSRSKREDVEQMKAAGERLAQRAREDPAFARQLLRGLAYHG